MRRVSLFVFAALILVTCLTHPVYAADSDIIGLINVLNYSTADNSGTNSFSSNGTYSATTTYEIPFRPYVRYVDIVFSSASGDPSSVYFRNNQLTIEKITNRYFRAYGEVDVTGSTFNLTFNSNTSGVTYAIASFLVSDRATNSFPIEAYCDISSFDYSATIHYVPDDEINYRQFLGTLDYDSTYLNLQLYTEDWKKYDFIDFQLFITCFDIHAISAVLGPTVIPVEVSMVDSSNYIINDYYITIRLDLRGLDRTIDDYPVVFLDGVVAQDLVNEVNVYNVAGHVSIDNIDSESFWLYTIKNSISAGFSSVGSWISSQTQSFVSSIDQLKSSLTSHFEQLETSLTSHFTNLDAWIEYQTYSIEQDFQITRKALSTHFDNLNSWISSQTETMINLFDQLQTSLTLHFTNLDEWIQYQTYSIEQDFQITRKALSTHFNNLFSEIQNQTDILESAIRGDTAPGDSFQDKVEQKDDELEDMADVMESVTQPALDSVNVSADQMVDTQVLVVSMSGLTSIIQPGSIFYTMIVMSIMMATASYVLFGKR